MAKEALKIKVIKGHLKIILKCVKICIEKLEHLEKSILEKTK